jgi:hypothetical protein
MNGLVLPGRQVFLVDTHVNYDPSAEQLAEITVLAAEEMRASASSPRRRCCRTPTSAPATTLGSEDARRAGAAARAGPLAEVDGEMHGDTALDPAYRRKLMPRCTLQGEANLLVLPNIDAANIKPTTCSRRRPAAASPSGRCCWGGQAGAHPDAVGHGAAHRQHDGLTVADAWLEVNDALPKKVPQSAPPPEPERGDANP